MAKTWWWVVVPPAEQNAGSVPKDAKIVSTQEGSKAYNTWLSTDAGTVTINGRPYVRYMGPFATRADAVKAAPGHLGILDYVKAGVSTFMNAVINKPQDKTTVQNEASGNVPNPLAGLASIGDFFSRLTNPHTWLRVAEVIVGGAFLIIGLNALLHNPAGKIAKAVPKVVPI